MIDALTVAVSVAALLLAAWCGCATARDQSTKDWHFIAMAVVSVLALAQLVVGVVELAGGRKPGGGTVIFVAYLAGAVLAIPAAGFMSLLERTRWGSATVAAGGVVLAVLEVRLFDIWEAGMAEAPATQRRKIGEGPGRLLVSLYAVFTVAAASRSIYQLIAQFHQAPLAYVLSAAAAVVYAFITVALVRGGESARRLALVCCAAELAGVLVVGTLTIAVPSAFPDQTVWSYYGMGYLFIPLVLPVTGMLWLRTSAPARQDASGPTAGQQV